MASFNFHMPDGLQAQLAKLANIDEIAPKMIDEATPILVEAIKKRTPVDTGALKRSVNAREAKQTKTGAWVGEVRFSGKDSKGVYNDLKAGALEYGHALHKYDEAERLDRKEKSKHQFIAPAVKDCEQKVVNKMQEVFEREMEK